ncbi:MAG: DEAD/DEAH box helicase [Xanthobacteraceae bacterium]
MAAEAAPAAGGAAAGAHWDFADQRSHSNNARPRAAQVELRPYQRAAVERIAAEARRRILVVAPTGSGKTVIAADLIDSAAANGKRVLVLVHRRELVQQTSRKLYEAGVDAGIIAAGFQPRHGERVQVGSIATLHARAMRTASIELPDADVVVVDEAHHCRARTWRRLIEAYPEATVIGLTATPCRADGRGLGSIFEALIEVASVAELIAGGFLVKTKVYAPVRPDLTGVHVKHGDYVESELAERMNTAQLVGDIVEHWHKLAEGRRTVIFAVNVAHSVHLRDEFRRSGVLAEHIDGSTPIDERAAILAKLAAGTIEIVTNCQVLTEGWDCPEVSCVVLARPTRSLGIYRQMTGRTLRPAPGKADALVLDHAGAVFQHGFVDDPIEWALHEDRRAENKAHSARCQYRAPALTCCPECGAVRFEGQPCTVCGWRAVTKPQHVDIADGELSAVDRNRSVGPLSYTAKERASFHRQLLYIARERGYRDGWAAHKFKEKFGDWPADRQVIAIEPTLATRAWVRSRQIAYAKAMAAAGAS